VAVTDMPVPATSHLLFKNGQKIEDYTLSGQTFYLLVPPKSGDLLELFF
jgi:hypothetical protein